MATTRYAGDRFVGNVGSPNSDATLTGVLDGAYYINTGNLTQYVKRRVGGWAQLAGGGGGGTPGGDNTQVQFNNAGAFGGSTGLTFDGQRLYANNLQISGIIYDSNNSYGEGGMVLTNEGTTGVNWKNIESVLSGVGGSGVANYVARWSDEDTITTGVLVDNGTRVGINVPSPSYTLEIADSSSPTVRIEDTTNNSRLDLRAEDSAVLIRSTSNFPMRFDVNQTERMRIATDGNVGIGTNNPAFKLQVQTPAVPANNAYVVGFDVSRPNSASRGFTVGSNSAADTWTLGAHNADMRLGHTYGTDTGGQPTFYPDLTIKHSDQSAGNVGIGTTDPGGKLESYITSGGQKGLRLNSNFAGGNTVDFIPAIVGVSNAGFSIDLAGTNRLVINSGGNVGVGTNSPSHRLHVLGATTGGWNGLNLNVVISSSNTYANGHAGGIAFGGAYNSSETQTVLAGVWASRPNAGDGQYAGMVHIGAREHGTSNIEKVLNVSHASVGIGTNLPTSMLQVDHSGGADVDILTLDNNRNTQYDKWGIKFQDSFRTRARIQTVNMNTGNARAGLAFEVGFSTDTVERMRINDNGNVGIGTDNPLAHLMVGDGNRNAGAAVQNQAGYFIGTKSAFSNAANKGLWQGQLHIADDSALAAGIGGAITFGATQDNTNGTYLASIEGSRDNATSGQYGASMIFRTRTNGSAVMGEHMVIASDGNVGIGTTSPTLARLQVVGSGSTQRDLLALQSTNNHAQLRIISEASTYSSYIKFQDNSGAAERYFIQADPSDNLLFRPQGTGTAASQIIFNSAGNIAVGRTAAGAKIDIATAANTNGFFIRDVSDQSITHNLYIDGNGNGVTAIYSDGQTGPNIQLHSAGVTFFNGGSVGIGHGSPLTDLDVRNNIGVYGANSSTSGQIYLGSSDFANSSYFNSAPGIGAIISAGDSQTNGLGFYTYTGASNSRTEKMRIEDDGKVGIGTTTPLGKLHVYGGQVRILDSTASPSYGARLVVGRDTAQDIEFYVDDLNCKIIADQDSDTDGNHNFVLDRSFAGNGDNNFQIQKGGSSQLLINTDGNVGINNTSPEHRLHVAGDAIISGYLYDSTNSTGVDGYVLTSKEDGPQWQQIEDVLSGVGGNGTANYIPKWEDEDTLGDSVIAQSGTAIGIGTATPAASLHIAAQAPRIRLEDTLDTSNYSMITADNGQVTVSADEGNAQGNSAQIFKVDNNEIMRMNGANVGIGTNAPSGKLHIRESNPGSFAYDSTADTLIVEGNGNAGITIATAAANTSRIIFASPNDATGAEVKYSDATSLMTIGNTNPGDSLALQAGNGAEAVRIVSGGSVGIGTTNPLYTVHVKAAQGIVRTDSTTGTNRSGFQMANTGGTGFIMATSSAGNGVLTTGGLAYALQINKSGGSTDAWNAVQIGTKDIARMTIDESGYVGIGTNSPSTALDVVGQGLFTNNGANIILKNTWSSGNQDILFGGGSVSTGAATNTAARIRSLATAPGGAATGDLLFTVNSGDSLVDALYIQEDGNVGIGTLTTAQKLHVAGSTLISNNNYHYGYTSGGALATLIGITDSNNLIVGQNNSNFAHAYIYGGTGDINLNPVGDVKVNNANLFVDGSVGIGIDSPGAPLHIYQNSASALEILFENDGAGQTGLTLRSDRNSDGNLIGFLNFDGNDDGNSNTRYGTIEAFIADNTGGTEDGRLTFSTMVAGSDTETMHIMGGSVGIGAAPAAPLDIHTANSSGAALRIISGNKLQFLNAANNTNANIYNSGATNKSELAFQISGSTKVTIDNGGNVGIGTTVPSAAYGPVLHVRGGNPVLRLDGTGVNSWAWITMNTATATEGRAMGLGADGSFRVTADPDSMDADIQLRITQAGAVQFGDYGSGTHTGTTAYRLSVDSSGNIIETAIGAGYVDGSGTANTIPRWTDADTIGDSIITVPSNTSVQMAGELTLNYTSPILNIGKLNTSTGNAKLRFNSKNGTAANAFDIQFVKSATEDRLDFLAGGATTMASFLNGGQVGIGTTNPSTAKLYVRGGASSQTFLTGADELIVEGSDHAGISILAPAAKRAQLYFNSDAFLRWVDNDGVFSIDTSASASKIALGPSGADVGVGTDSPDSKLHVLGDTLKLERANNAPAFKLYNNSASPADDAALGYLQFTGKDNNGTANMVYSEVRGGVQSNTNSAVSGYLSFLTTNNGTAVTEAMRIKADGSVGIATTNPAAKLDVSGNILRSGLYYSSWTSRSINTLTSGGSTINYILIAPKTTINVRLSGRFNCARGNGVSAVSIAHADIVFCTDNDANPQSGGIHSASSDIPSYGHANFEIVELTYNSADYYALKISPSVSWVASFNHIEFEGISNNVTWTNIDSGNVSNIGAFGGSQAVFAYKHANVGIGTDSPAARLHITSDGSHDEGAEIVLRHANNNSTDVVSTLSFQNNGGQVAMIQAGTTSGNTNGYISLFTDNSGTSAEKMRIISDGNIGIGTTDPGVTLDVRGKLSIGSPNASYDLYNNGTTYLNDNVTIDALLSITGTAASQSIINSSTTDSAAADSYLNIFKTAGSGGGSRATLRVGYDATTCFQISRIRNDANIYINSRQSGSSMVFQIADNEQMSLSSGQLKFPDSKKIIMGAGNDLQIYHDGDNWIDANGAGDLYLRNLNSSGDVIVQAGASGDAYIKVHSGETALKATNNGAVELYYNNTKMFQTTASGASVVGTTGINVSPGASGTYGSSSAINNLISLTMPYGSSAATTSNAGARVGIAFRGATSDPNPSSDNNKTAAIYGVSEDTGAGYSRKMGLALYTSSFDATASERVRINADGKVGIGTTSPSYELHVVGSSYSSVRLGVQALNTSYIATLGGTTNNKLVLTGSTNPFIRFQEGSTDRGYIQWHGAQNSLLFRNQEADNFDFVPHDDTGAVELRLRGSDLDVWGSVYAEEGSSEAHTVGFRDGDGDWAARHVKDTSWDFRVNDDIKLSIASNGAIQFNTYGSETHTGTAAYQLAVDANGNVIETTDGGGNVSGSGTSGKIAKWSGANGLTDSSFLSESGTTLTNTATTFKIASASGDGVLQVYGAGGGDDGRVELLNQSGSTAEGFRIRYDNDVGDTYFDNMWAGGSDANPAIRFRTKTAGTAVNAMTINHGGNVGIGTTAPNKKLHVNGGSDANLRLTSASTRSGIFIDKPGTTTIMGSALVLADETYRLGTASYYHVNMTQGGVTALLYQGSTKIATTSGGVTVTGTLTETSSIAIKENVETYTPSLDIINKIRPVKYNRKENKKKKEIGLIAEELAELFPELVEKDEKGNPSSVNYSRAVTVLLGGFKELYKEVQELKKRI